MVATRKRKKKSSFPTCNHMSEMHYIPLQTIEVLSLVSAATHAVRSGYDDATEFLETAVNTLLNVSNIDCTFKKDGTMVLTVNPEEKRKVRKCKPKSR